MDEKQQSLDRSIMRRIGVRETPPAGGAFGRKKPIGKKTRRLGHYTVVLNTFKTMASVELYSGFYRLARWDTRDIYEAENLYSKVISSVIDTINDERSAMEESAKKITGYSFVPEPTISYYVERGVNPYELPPMLQSEKGTTGVVVSDNIELLMHVYSSIPIIRTHSHIAVIDISVPEDRIIQTRDIADAETSQTSHLWAVSRLNPEDIISVSGVLQNPNVIGQS